MQARAGAGARLAFFAPTTLLARELRGALEGRGFPALDIKLFDDGADGSLAEYAGEALVVSRPDEDVAGTIDIAFMCGSAAETTPYLDWPARRGFVAIDLSGATQGRDDVPLVHAGLNADDIRAGGGGGAVPLIAAPHAVSHNLATVVCASAAAGRLERVDALCFRPVSDFGEKGVDELYRQTLALLNFGEVPREIFGRQIAFNIVPSNGITPCRAEAFEERARAETARLTGGGPEIGLTSAFIPVFHGHAMFITMTFAAPCREEEVLSALGASRGVRLIDNLDAFSPVDLAGEEDVAVIPSGRRGAGVSVWSFCDNLKGGAALNAIRIAERVADLIPHGTAR